MSDEILNGAAAESQAQPQAASFTVEKLYVKDLSFEAPNAPQVFNEQGQPDLQMKLAQKEQRLADTAFEVSLTVTLTCTVNGRTAYLAEVDFKQPSVPLICNTDAQPLSAETARRHLVDHLTHPVRFEQSVQSLVDQGAAVFAEVGFGGVLSNLVKRIDRKAARPCIQDAASFDAFVSEYAEDKE